MKERNCWIEALPTCGEVIEQAQREAEYLYVDGDVPKRLIGEHAICNAFAELAWHGFAVKPNEPEFQARWRGIGE